LGAFSALAKVEKGAHQAGREVVHAVESLVFEGVDSGGFAGS
jgi:hypothetical protein